MDNLRHQLLQKKKQKKKKTKKKKKKKRLNVILPESCAVRLDIKIIGPFSCQTGVIYIFRFCTAFNLYVLH